MGYQKGGPHPRFLNLNQQLGQTFINGSHDDDPASTVDLNTFAGGADLVSSQQISKGEDVFPDPYVPSADFQFNSIQTEPSSSIANYQGTPQVSFPTQASPSAMQGLPSGSNDLPPPPFFMTVPQHQNAPGRASGSSSHSTPLRVGKLSPLTSPATSPAHSSSVQRQYTCPQLSNRDKRREARTTTTDDSSSTATALGSDGAVNYNSDCLRLSQEVRELANEYYHRRAPPHTEILVNTKGVDNAQAAMQHAVTSTDPIPAGQAFQSDSNTPQAGQGLYPTQQVLQHTPATFPPADQPFMQSYQAFQRTPPTLPQTIQAPMAMDLGLPTSDPAALLQAGQRAAEYSNLPHLTYSESAPVPLQPIPELSEESQAILTATQASQSQSKKKTNPTYHRMVLDRLETHGRTGQACNRCKIRKIKCDADPMGCSSCRAAGEECVITDPTTKKAHRRGHIEEIETNALLLWQHIRHLEARLLQHEPKLALLDPETIRAQTRAFMKARAASSSSKSTSNANPSSVNRRRTVRL